jgi:hypothetical protein
MKNKEKYEKEIMNIACSGDSIAILKKSGRIVSCNVTKCCLCLFRGSDCKEKLRDWAESEYVEKLVISKMDRAFLEYLGKELKYIARSKSDNLMAFQNSAEKRGDGWGIGSGEFKSLKKFNIDFPMVKWSDGKPWLIEDLKKLEVVEEYE